MVALRRIKSEQREIRPDCIRTYKIRSNSSSKSRLICCSECCITRPQADTCNSAVELRICARRHTCCKCCADSVQHSSSWCTIRVRRISECDCSTALGNAVHIGSYRIPIDVDDAANLIPRARRQNGRAVSGLKTVADYRPCSDAQDGGCSIVDPQVDTSGRSIDDNADNPVVVGGGLQRVIVDPRRNHDLRESVQQRPNGVLPNGHVVR